MRADTSCVDVARDCRPPPRRTNGAAPAGCTPFHPCPQLEQHPQKETSTLRKQFKTKCAVTGPALCFAGSSLSTTQRLWPAAPMTVTAQASRDNESGCRRRAARGRQRARTATAIPPRPSSDQGHQRTKRCLWPGTREKPLQAKQPAQQIVVWLPSVKQASDAKTRSPRTTTTICIANGKNTAVATTIRRYGVGGWAETEKANRSEQRSSVQDLNGVLERPGLTAGVDHTKFQTVFTVQL